MTGTRCAFPPENNRKKPKQEKKKMCESIAFRTLDIKQ